MTILIEIKLKNFKSFRGIHKIGPLVPFVGVIGPNGAGKSNFMDAIGFAMGMSSKNLRVSKVQELVYTEENDGDLRSMFVAVTLLDSENVCKHFTRSLEQLSSRYYINNEPVTRKEYLDNLKSVQIVPTSSLNFLVFQDKVESIIMQNAKDRTLMFEEISGSRIHKDEYERLKAEKLKLEQDLHYLQQTKKCLMTDLKKLRNCRRQAHEYSALEKEHAATRIQLLLFRLYYIEKDIKMLRENERVKQEALHKLVEAKREAEKGLEEIMQKYNSSTTIAAEIEENLGKKQEELNQVTAKVITASEEVKRAQKRVDSFRKSLEAAKKADDVHRSTVEDLKNALEIVNCNKTEVCRKFDENRGNFVELVESQANEYERLKKTCCIKFVKERELLGNLERDLDSLQDKVDNAKRKCDETKSGIVQKNRLRDETRKRIDKWKEYVKTIDQELNIKAQTRKKIVSSVSSLKEKAETLSKELENVTEQLGNCRIDGYEMERARKKNTVVNNLKQLFPGVLNRLCNLCRPIHSRYNIAFAKIFNKSLDSIVVDATKTAQDCIRYLREQRIGVETFLPIDDLDVETLKERLRKIQDPPNVKLLYDVIDFSPPEVGRAVLHVAKNILVCETPEDAEKVAYRLDNGNRYNCVSLDGCYYQKSGIISGGTLDLARTVQKWDSRKEAAIKARKLEVSANLQEIRKELEKECSQAVLSELSSTVECLKSRLKFGKIDLVNAERELVNIDKEIEVLTTKLNSENAALDKANTKKNDMSMKIAEVKAKIDEEEDKIFAEFCKKLNIDNIRQYETDERKVYEETLHDLNMQISRISDQLQFEKRRDTESSNVRRWTEKLNDAENVLKLATENENEAINLAEECKKMFQDVQNTYRDLETEIDNLKEQILLRRCQLKSVTNEYQSLSKDLNVIKMSIEKNRSQRHSIFTKAKVDGLEIPITNGLEFLHLDSSDSHESSTPETADIYERETNIEVDFSNLIDSLSNLSIQEAGAAREKLERQVTELSSALNEMADPHMKASQEFLSIKEKSREIDGNIAEMNLTLQEARRSFEEIKKERYDQFMKLFDLVANKVDSIYKEVTRDKSAQAYLVPENPEEPYLAGIHYHCLAPGKRFQVSSNLSGGEKSLAALALLFAIQRGNPPPFQILDEVDAAMDKKNTTQLMEYIRSTKELQQSIVISHKREMFAGADVLIGVVSGTTNSSESQIITLDLSNWRPSSIQQR